ncbi:hypothetical protein BDR07DRAFT_1392700 [Suillus spraguei]|nr:hypothetical protein BDR07DRAFT_1392700 [Suillus spraguei]
MWQTSLCSAAVKLSDSVHWRYFSTSCGSLEVNEEAHSYRWNLCASVFNSRRGNSSTQRQA